MPSNSGSVIEGVIRVDADAGLLAAARAQRSDQGARSQIAGQLRGGTASGTRSYPIVFGEIQGRFAPHCVTRRDDVADQNSLKAKTATF